MQSCIRRRNRAATVARYRRLEVMLWRGLELLPSQETCLLYEMAMRGGYDFHEEGSMKDKNANKLGTILFDDLRKKSERRKVKCQLLEITHLMMDWIL